jgi:hypothetical protein
MMLTKSKIITGILVATVALAGSAWVGQHALAQKPRLNAGKSKKPTVVAAPVEKDPHASKLDLNPENFAKLRATIQPQGHEWRHLKVHWHTDIVAARKKAAAEDRPILVFRTGGAGYNDPLGQCWGAADWLAGGQLGDQLSDEAIQLLNERFVPYAPSWGDGKDKYPWWQATWKDFFANHAEKLKMSTLPGSIWFTLTAAGHPVPASKVRASGAKSDLADTLKQILELYAQLPESQRKPSETIRDANRPTPAPPPGGVVLTCYDRFLQRDERGEYHAIVGHRTPTQPLSVPGPQRNSLWLTRAECAALMPYHPRKGQTIAAPAPLARRVFLFGFIPASAWQGGYEWKADSARGGSFTLTVEEVSGSRVNLRLHGSGVPLDFGSTDR